MRFFALFALLFSLASPLVVWADAPLKVAVSIPPQKYFVDMIGGKHVQVDVLVPPTAEPETYEPSPRQLVALSQAALYLKIGIPIENAWLTRFTSVNPNFLVVDTARGIQRVDMSRHVGVPTSETGMDPHIWLSPVLVRIQAINIRDALIQADPAHAADYRLGYEKLALKINQVDSDILHALTGAHLTQTRFIVFHPAFGYFADAYGLTQVPIEAEGKEAGPKQMSTVINYAKAHHIKVVFIEPQFAQKAARTIASEIGGQVAVIDPLQENWPAGMEAIATALSKVLGTVQHAPASSSP
ncbi:metal ABC transporter solute-binding protein, Zn/Mn family [Halothiobacillus sp.]|uniref:metal ABC transporter solute-binding protein, Zn/Mn family n=1 Tax=Halothiobacillus sp. TaxID=1891311 RepID=UPI002AD500FF|nr:zinc ABC transporter substrate-binding protein [Halothiobacillus sp.]